MTTAAHDFGDHYETSANIPVVGRQVEVDNFWADDRGVDEAEEDEAADAVARRVSEVSAARRIGDVRREDALGESLRDGDADELGDLLDCGRDLVD